MSYETDTAKRYRRFAAELREIAKHDRTRETREPLLRVAEDYETMAATLEQIEQESGASKRVNLNGRRAPFAS